jgi:ribonuclease Z
LEDDEQESCIQKGHSTPSMAAKFAKSIGAKKLILTHYSARYAGSNKEENDSRISINLLKEQAIKVFGDSVELAEDFKVFEIKKNK